MSWASDIGKGFKKAYKKTAKKWGNPFTKTGALNLLSGGAIGIMDYGRLQTKVLWKSLTNALVKDMREDREAMVSSSVTGRKLVYGRSKVGSQLVYASTGGLLKDSLFIVVVFTGHEIDSFEEIWFDDRKMATFTNGAWVKQSPFTNLVTIQTYTGDQSEGHTLANMTGWTVANHKLLGCSYGIFKLKYNEQVFSTGVPKISAVMKGKKVYDPRTGLTAWTSNSALCVYDYAVMPTFIGGGGFAPEEININVLMASADICDEQCLVSGTTYENRYSTNGMVSLDTTPASIISSLISPMAGTAVYTEGQWKFYAGAPGRPATTYAYSGGVVAGTTQRTAIKTSGADGTAWDAQAYSEQGYVGGVSCSAKVPEADSYIIFGLNTDPSASTTGSTIDYAWYCASSGAGGLLIWENGASVGYFGSYTADTVLSITYDGATVEYLKDGVVIRSVSVVITDALYFDSSFNRLNKQLTNIEFGPIGEGSYPVATIDESWLDGGISFSTGANKNEKINTVKGLFTDPSNRWADTDFPSVPVGLTTPPNASYWAITATPTPYSATSDYNTGEYVLFSAKVYKAVIYTPPDNAPPDGLYWLLIEEYSLQKDYLATYEVQRGQIAYTAFVDVPAANPYMKEDGEELTLAMQLPFTTSPSQAARLANIELRKSRLGVTITYPCNLRAFVFDVWDVILVNNTLLGWNEKQCRVMGWGYTPGGGVTLTLAEDSDEVWSWDSTSFEPFESVELSDFPDPTNVLPPVNFTVTEEIYAGLVASVIKSKLTLAWTAGDETASMYDIRLDGVIIQTIPEVSYVINDIEAGIHNIAIRAKNWITAVSDWVEADYNVMGKGGLPTNVSGFSAELTKGQMLISWFPNTDVDILGYEIQLGTTWDDDSNVKLVERYAGTSYPWTPTTSGNVNLLIKAIDTSLNYSESATSFTYIISAPGSITGLTQKVIDNIVDLRWTPGTVGSFPIDYYELWKGTTFAAATLIGRKYGTFDIISESLAGTFKYWVRAVDIAGLPSTEVGVYTVVNQPPDYVLIDDQNLVFSSCTLVNAIIEGSDIIIPVNTTITWENHFQSNPDTTLEPWSTPQDQIDDGYTYYTQPGPSTSSIEKIIDYGATIPQSKITMGVTRSELAGTVTFTPEILTSPDNSTYTSLGNVYEAAASSFRYVKYRLVATTSNGGVSTIQQINVKLDVKQKTTIGSMNVADTTGDGTSVTFSSLGISPVDVVGNPLAEAPYIPSPYTVYGGVDPNPIKALVNFVDVPNPTAFKVLAWDKAGTRVAVNNVTVTVRYI